MEPIAKVYALWIEINYHQEGKMESYFSISIWRGGSVVNLTWDSYDEVTMRHRGGTRHDQMNDKSIGGGPRVEMSSVW